MFEALISLGSLATGGYSVVSGISQFKQLQNIEEKIEALGIRFEKLSDSLLYLPTKKIITDVSKEIQDTIKKENNVNEILQKIQKTVETPIVSSTIIKAPDKMVDVINENPWDVLIDIKPFSEADNKPRPGMIPLLFEFQELKFVGWQMVGALKILFDLDYHAESEIWLPGSTFKSDKRLCRNAKCPCGSKKRFKHCCGKLPKCL